ncbi:MAG: DUF58 domain-containing protein [Bacteroidales bacterium]
MPINYIDRSRLKRFSNLELVARQVVEGFITGMHKSPFHGFSVEFAEHRQYNQGESTRHIDWKLYGRTDRLYVKRYEEETNLRCQILVDVSSSMYYPVKENPGPDDPNKMVFSVYAAAAIIQMLLKQRDAAGLSLFSDHIQQHTRARSTQAHLQYLYGNLERHLQQPKPDEKHATAVSTVLHNIAERIPKRSLVVIFSDMFDSYEDTGKIFSALQHLKHNKHEVILFHTIEKSTEFDFVFENRPYKFIDMEGGNELKLNPREIRSQYLQRIGSFRKQLKLRCGQYKIDYVEADISKGFEQVLLPYFRKRKKMF